MADEKKTTEEAVAPDPNEGPGKGQQFFDRAKTVGSTGNFDYAIEMYIQGLNREPFNVTEHQALRNVAMHRKVSGAKSGGGLSGLLGGGPKLPFKGKTPKEAMLNAEFRLTRDVGSLTEMLTIIRNADLLGIKEVVMWMGPMLREANKTNKSPKSEIFTELASIYAKYEEFGKACDVINDAAQMKPDDGELAQLVNHYAAQATIQKGKYAEEGDFKKSLKSAENTRDLLEQDSLQQSDDYLLKVLAQAKVDYEANPKELQVISKYVKALVDTEQEENENKAMDVLKKAYVETRVYRFKYTADDVRIKQLKRNQRLLKEAAKADLSDKETAKQFEQASKERLTFELETFHERAEYMPTEMTVKFEYGMRLWEARRFDEALVALQEAQQNPKHRVEALHYLGRAFYELGMMPEAVDTAQRSIEEYDLASTGDTRSMTLYYWYGRALEGNKQLKEAVDVYSKVIRWNIAFLDARKRLQELRAKLDGGAPA